MASLKIGPLVDERPTKLTVELPPAIYRDLQAYGALLAKASGDDAPVEPTRLIAPMLEHFMASDRGFTKERKVTVQTPAGGSV